MKKLASILIMVAFIPQAWASSAYLTFSEKSAELGASTGGDYKSTADFGFSAYYNDENDVSLTGDMLTNLEGDSSSQWLFSLGARLFIAQFELREKEEENPEKRFTFGLMPQMQAGYRFLSKIPVAAVVHIAYSPTILNNSDLVSLQQTGLFLEFMLGPSAIAQVGYRNYRALFESDIFHLEENDKVYEDSAVAGMKIRF